MRRGAATHRRKRGRLSREHLEPRELLDGDSPLGDGATADTGSFPRDEIDLLIADDDLSRMDDPIGEDLQRQDVDLVPAPPAPDGPRFPSGVQGRDGALFPLDLLDQQFFVFDDMRLNGEVDFVNDFNFQPLQRYGNWHFFPAGSDLTEADPERTREFARRLDPRRLFVINIEHWATTGSAAVIQESIRKLSSVVDIIREENPTVVLGIYRMLPVRDYSTPVTYGYDSPRYDAWAANNAALQELADKVDVIMPSIYTFYPDYYEDGSPRLFERDRWVTYATANLLEARQYGKPVISYIWPFYHGGGGSADPNAPDYRYWKYQPIGGEFWKLILETNYAYADGTIIWAGLDFDFDPDSAWWMESLAFVDQVGPARASSEVTVIGTRQSGGLRDLRANDVASIWIHVTSVNDPPVAKNDLFFTPQNTPITVFPLQDNGHGADSDVDGTLLPDTLTVVQSPSGGELVNHGDGSLTYSPLPGFQGSDQFSYAVGDDAGGLSNTATVIVVVNTSPVAIDDVRTTLEDQPVTIYVLSNNGFGADVDVDGNLDASSHTVVNGPAGGTLLWQPNGAFVYTPTTNFAGTDSFTYTVRDLAGAVSNEATVTIFVTEVNDPPIARRDDVVTDEDTAVMIDVSADNGYGPDLDLDGTLLPGTATLVAPPAHGTLAAVGNATYRYTPEADFHGTDNFSYRIQDEDGAFSTVATVAVVVLPINDAPVAFDDVLTTAVGTPVTIDVTQEHGKGADFDVDLDPLTAELLEPLSPFGGSVGRDESGHFVYTPLPGFRGADFFHYVLADGNGGRSRSATVTIFVNTPPVAADDTITLSEDGVLRFSVLTDHGQGVDFDPDGAVRRSTVIATGAPANGQLTNHRDGTFTYQPFPNYHGTDSFTYVVADNELAFSQPALVTLEVLDLNDPPVARDDAFLTALNFSLQLNLLEDHGNGPDEDLDGQLQAGLTAIVSPPGHGQLTDRGEGQFRYTPNAGFLGFDQFTYTVQDDDGATSEPATVTIEVRDFNLPPIARDDAFTTDEDIAIVLHVLLDQGNGADEDLDGTLDLTSLEIASPPLSGSISIPGDGTLIYTPNLNFSGGDSFTYTIRDDEQLASNVAVVTVDVTPVNDAPLLQDDWVTVAEDTSLAIDVLVDHGNGPDSDVDGTLVLSSLVVVNGPLHGTLSNEGNGTFTYTPQDNYFGSDQFQYQGLDDQGSLSNLATVTIDITPVNDRPVAGDDNVTTQEDEAVVIDLLSDHGGGVDQDLDGTLDLMSVVVTTAPDHGMLLVGDDGTVRYTPESDYHGQDLFQYTIADDMGAASDPAAVVVTIVDVNDPPIAADDQVTTRPGTPLMIDVVFDHGGGVDFDVDGSLDTDQTDILASPSDGTLQQVGNGVFEYTPTSGYPWQ